MSAISTLTPIQISYLTPSTLKKNVALLETAENTLIQEVNALEFQSYQSSMKLFGKLESIHKSSENLDGKGDKEEEFIVEVVRMMTAREVLLQKSCTLIEHFKSDLYNDENSEGSISNYDAMIERENEEIKNLNAIIKNLVGVQSIRRCCDEVKEEQIYMETSIRDRLNSPPKQRERSRSPRSSGR